MGLNFGQNLFPPRGELLVNYDYKDISEGVGYNVYYGAKGDNGEYIVSPNNSVYSEEIVSFIGDQSIATSATKYFDLDFDLEFNQPKNIKGDVLINVPIGISASNGTHTFECYCIVKVIHYDGSTETQIATGTSKTISKSIDPDKEEMNGVAMLALIKANVSALQHFKGGDILRFTIEGWYKTTSAGAHAAHIFIGHDPQARGWNRSDPDAFFINHEFTLGNTFKYTRGASTYIVTEYIPTQMSFHVPFKLDI